MNQQVTGTAGGADVTAFTLRSRPSRRTIRQWHCPLAATTARPSHAWTTALLVGAVVIGVILILQVVSWVVGAFMFGLKVLIAVAIGYVVLRLVNRGDRSRNRGPSSPRGRTASDPGRPGTMLARRVLVGCVHASRVRDRPDVHHLRRLRRHLALELAVVHGAVVVPTEPRGRCVGVRGATVSTPCRRR